MICVWCEEEIIDEPYEEFGGEFLHISCYWELDCELVEYGDTGLLCGDGEVKISLD